MIIDIGLAVVLWLDREIPIIKDLFRPANLLLFIPLVLFSGYYFDPASLGWWDSNISNFFKFEVITENGNVYNFPTSRFEPYNLPFAQSRFYFLYDEAILSGTYGAATNRESWAALRIAEDQNSIEAVRQEYGRILYDEERAEDFLEFLLIWFTTKIPLQKRIC